MANDKKRVMTGRVSKDKMNKSVVVQVSRRVPATQYKKIITRINSYQAHDEKNECKVGDIVEIEESRPISKHKHWVVTRIVEKAVEV